MNKCSHQGFSISTHLIDLHSSGTVQRHGKQFTRGEQGYALSIRYVLN